MTSRNAIRTRRVRLPLVWLAHAAALALTIVAAVRCTG